MDCGSRAVSQVHESKLTGRPAPYMIRPVREGVTEGRPIDLAGRWEPMMERTERDFCPC